MKKFTPAEAEYLEKLGVFQELETVLKSGDYRKILHPEEKDRSMPRPRPEKSQSDLELMPPPAKIMNKPPVEDEDNAIQDLLEDIRGSFERQFDDEFNDLHSNEAPSSTSNPNSSGNSRASSPFANINIGPTFSMSDGAVLEDLAASAEDLLASSPDEMLLEGFTMSQEVFDNFLEAAAHPGTSHDPNFDYSAHPDPNQPF